MLVALVLLDVAELDVALVALEVGEVLVLVVLAALDVVVVWVFPVEVDVVVVVCGLTVLPLPSLDVEVSTGVKLSFSPQATTPPATASANQPIFVIRKPPKKRIRAA